MEFILIIIIIILIIALISKKKAENNEYDKQIEDSKEELKKLKEKITASEKSLQVINNEVIGKTEKAHEISSLIESDFQERKKKLEDYYFSIEKSCIAEYNMKKEELEVQHNLDCERISREFDEKVANYNKEEEILKSEIAEFKAARMALIESQKREEEIQQNKNFYCIQLKEENLSDIIQLKKLLPLFYNKEIISKLIYDAYYKKPMTDMFGRVAGSKKPCGIYKITNQKNGKIYIGKSVEIAPRRWSEHIKSSLGIGTISHSKIHDALNEDGINNFTFEILEECPKDKLFERESYWIKFYESDIYGYNIKG